MVIDTSGNVKLEADISTDLMIRMALMRRGLAMDQCGLLDYHKHDLWVERIFDVRTDAPLDGFSHVAMAQVIQADRKLFLKLAELTRDGIRITATGKPLDGVFETASQRSDVLRVLQPVPLPKVPRTEKAENQRSTPYDSKGSIRTKGKGKSKGSTTIQMPAGLEDGVPATRSGNPLCFDYNFGKCRLRVTKGRCRAGLRLCCFKNCHKADHHCLACAMRKQGGA